MINLILILSLFNQIIPESDPRLNWYVFETDHFAIHMPSRTGLSKEEENLARRFGAICEKIDSFLVPFFRYRPKGKVNVIIADFYDFAQGWSMPFPHNTITVMPTHPTGDLTNYDDWFFNLILHEYTHTLLMDKVYGLPNLLRKIFGRIIVPQALTPLWLQEGFAVYNESKYTQFGRAKSSEYTMKIRAPALTNKLLPIDQVQNYELRKYPSGEAPYIYGSQFFLFLANRFGDGKLVKYTDYNAHCLPFFTNLSARRVFGKSFCSLWRDWQDSLIIATKQLAESLSQQSTESKQVTKIGYDIHSPQFSKYGEKIYFISYNPNELPSIKSLDLITRETKTIFKGYLGKTLSISPDGGELLFSLRNVFNNYYEFDDIFSFSLSTNTLNRITNGLRARDPEFAPAGDKIVFVENRLGKNCLTLLNRSNKKIDTLIEGEDYTQFFCPKFSPDGKKIAVAIWQTGGYQDILVIDLESGWHIPITDDLATDIQPAFSPDSKYLLFSSDRTGIFNLYAYSFENRQIYQVTNVLSGAFAPTISPDGKRIGFLGYSEKGYDIHFINFKPSAWRIAQVVTESVPTTKFTPKEVRLEIYQYDPLASIFPKFWLSVISYDTTISFGFFTAGIDVLLQHIIILTANYRPKEKNPYCYLSYISRKYPLNFYGFYEHNEQGAGISGYFPYHSTFSNHLISPYYEFNHSKSVRSAGLGLEYRSSNTKSYPYSISPVDGRKFFADISYFNRFLLSSYNLVRFQINYSKYIALPIRHNVFVARLTLATALGDSAMEKQYRFGGTSGLFSIRGYDKDSSGHQNVVKTTLEYRFPLFWVERGIGTAPFFLSNFSGSIGLDAGLNWDGLKLPNSQIFSESSKLSVFIELHSSWILTYLLPVSLKIGYAQGLINKGTGQIYFGVGSSLLNLLTEKKRLNAKDILMLYEGL